MGRGRQKAKQAKVARELKYASGGTDLEALQAELAAKQDHSDEYEDPYADLLDDADEDDEAEEQSR